MIFTIETTVGYSQVNARLELTNDSILKIFEDIACFHGNLAGENVLNSKTAWILTGYLVKVIRRPKYSEKIKVCTWARVIHGITSVREFEILDEEGSRCVIASSGWAHINIEDKSLTRVTPELVKAYDAEPDHKAFEEVGVPKLFAPDNMTKSSDFLNSRNLTDIHHHLNNVKYLELAYMAIPDYAMYINEPNEFIINFRKQLPLGSVAESFYAKEDDSLYVVLKNKETGDICATIKLGLKPDSPNEETKKALDEFREMKNNKTERKCYQSFKEILDEV